MGRDFFCKKSQLHETVCTADFRNYSCVEDSITDHSAYLLGAKNGKKLRYDGIAGITNYKEVAQLIRDGGYATSLTYVDNLCSIIEKWNLIRYDVVASTDTIIDESSLPAVPFLVKVIIDDLNYRSEPSMNGTVNGQTGIGTFTIVEESAGEGSTAGWGLLKAYQSNRSGWISLDYATKV